MFEANLQRLEDIVGQLDSDTVTLDQALKLFEEGVDLLRKASAELNVADARVKVLIEEADGVLATKEFDA